MYQIWLCSSLALIFLKFHNLGPHSHTSHFLSPSAVQPRRIMGRYPSSPDYGYNKTHNRTLIEFQMTERRRGQKIRLSKCIFDCSDLLLFGWIHLCNLFSCPFSSLLNTFVRRLLHQCGQDQANHLRAWDSQQSVFGQHLWLLGVDVRRSYRCAGVCPRPRTGQPG